MRTQHVINSTRNLLVLPLLALLAFGAGCSPNSVGSNQANPTIVVRIPDWNSASRYAILVRIVGAQGTTSAARNIYLPSENATETLATNGIGIQLQPNEFGNATTTVYALDSSECANRGTSVPLDITANKQYFIDFGAFQTFTPALCPLLVNKRSYGQMLEGGVVTSRQLRSDRTPIISCGTDCYAFVPSGSVVLDATAQPGYTLASWKVNGADQPPNNPLPVSTRTEVEVAFIRTMCQPNSYCRDTDAPGDLKLHAVSGTAADDVWALGEDLAGNGAGAYLSGGVWQRATFSTRGGPIAAVWADGRGSAWAVGAPSKVYRCQATTAARTCTEVNTTFSGVTTPMALKSISGFGSTLWILDANGPVYAGAVVGAGMPMTVLELGTDPIGVYSQIKATSANTAFVAGETLQLCTIGTGCRDQGLNPPVPSTYTTLATGTAGVDVLLGDDKGGVRRFLGVSPAGNLHPAASTRGINGLFRDAFDRVWIAGKQGLFEYWGDATLTMSIKLPDPNTSANLEAVWSTGQHTWIVGDKILLHYQAN